MGKKKLRREIARLRDTISHMEWEIKELIDNPDTLGSEIIKSNYRHKNELEGMMWAGESNGVKLYNEFHSDKECKPHMDIVGGISKIEFIPYDYNGFLNKLCDPLNCDGTCSKCNDCESDNNNV